MTRGSKFVLFGVITGLAIAGVGFRYGIGWLQGIGFLLAGAGAAFGMVGSYREGVIETNWGTVRRVNSPVWFQIVGAFWWAMISCWTIGGILVSLGVIGHK